MAKFRILSLDGGGIRGAFSASFMAELEKLIGDRPIGEYFDLIAGTSTGGIIAVALGLGERASKVKDFYEGRGASIFTPLPRASLGIKNKVKLAVATALRPLAEWGLAKFGLTTDDLLQAKYDSRELERCLKDVFQSRTLETARTRLVIPAVDLTCGRTVVFKTPHLPGLSRDRVYSAVDVLLATAAAPTYFPHARISQGSAYCDGGLWANNPSMCAYAEAVKIREKCKRDGIDPCFELDEIEMLSVGTGRPKYSLAPPELRAGLGWWGPRMVDVMFLSQAQGVGFQADYLLGSRHHRIDYDLPDSSWKLDRHDLIPRLVHLGYDAAHAAHAKLRPILFDQPAPRFEAFSLDAVTA